jgi:uncharacterized protein YecE (DUF72 family)
MLRIGCSGWTYDHWRAGTFYPPRLPQRRWLEFYAGRFDTVEVNSSFYRLPKRKAVERWAAATPERFLFAVKVSRYVTHTRRLAGVEESLPRLLAPLDPLLETGKLGPLLWQLPPNFARDDARLEVALRAFPARLRHAVEFRHASWFDPDVAELLRAHGVAAVVADRPEHHEVQPITPTADFVYIRFHHGSRGRRGNYSHAELESWAARISDWQRRHDVYAYFNNDWEGFAPANAAALAALLRPTMRPRTAARPPGSRP